MTALPSDARDWLDATGFTVKDEALWHAALTHGSMGERQDYERLEFLGDRVLGLSIADWLYAQSDAPEGKLAQRLNAIVSRAMCAQVARGIGLAPHIRISKQASSDGGRDSDNILGDVMEALLGAQFLDNGFETARDLVRLLWRPALESGAGKSKHPKSALYRASEGAQGGRGAGHREQQAGSREGSRARVHGALRVTGRRPRTSITHPPRPARDEWNRHD